MKKFRAYQPEQLFLLPESIDDWLPQEHLARFVGDLIEQLDLSLIIDSYGYEKGGQPPYHPLMMTKLIVYGYCVGVLSSRRIEEATWEQVPFRFIAANQHPRMGGIYNKYLDAWRELGGDRMCLFSSVSTSSKWGSWGLLEGADENSSPKFDAVAQWNQKNSR